MERKILLKTVRIYKYCPKCPGQMVSSKTGICTSINSVPLTMTSQGVGFAAYKCSISTPVTNVDFRNHTITHILILII